MSNFHSWKRHIIVPLKLSGLANVWPSATKQTESSAFTQGFIPSTLTFNTDAASRLLMGDARQLIMSMVYIILYNKEFPHKSNIPGLYSSCLFSVKRKVDFFLNLLV